MWPHPPHLSIKMLRPLSKQQLTDSELTDDKTNQGTNISVIGTTSHDIFTDQNQNHLEPSVATPTHSSDRSLRVELVLRVEPHLRAPG